MTYFRRIDYGVSITYRKEEVSMVKLNLYFVHRMDESAFTF
jgi:hypothetical protein